MVQLRGSRHLSCFYCGKRSEHRKGGLTRNFTCEQCEATNYLDENGDITDPPAAKTSSDSPKRRYAQTSAALPSSPADSVFCQTCLKNQRLFTASLAQYDKPIDSTRENERRYYQWRRQLESRYPQVCEDCKIRVDEKIRAAKYTAQTDHLRRMRERTRVNTRTRRAWSLLDVMHSLGGWMWIVAFFLQFAWHAQGVAGIVTSQEDGMYDPDEEGMATHALTVLRWVAQQVPADATLNASLTLGLICIWWNPQFVKSNRGFTRHLSGFKQWYSLQCLAFLLRWVLRPMFQLQQQVSGPEASSRQAILCAHGGVITLTFLIYHLSKKSIRADTRPLFGTESLASPSRSIESSPKSGRSPTSFAETLSQALDDTPPTKQLSFESKLKPLGSAYPPNKPFQSVNGPKPGLSRFDTPPSPPRETVQSGYSDDMDWTPTTSSHRAFQSQTSDSQARPFGHAPVALDQGPFWYKAPQVPQHPAHRLRNAPKMPVIHSQTGSVTPRSGLSFGSSTISTGTETGRSVTFGQPRFFAEERGSDEANSLVDMFGGAFTVKDSEDGDNGTRGQEVASHSIFALGKEQDQGNQAYAMSSSRDGNFGYTQPMTMISELLPTGAFVLLWLSWIFTSSGQLIQSNVAQPSILILAAILSTACLGILVRRVRSGQLGKSVIPLLFICLRAVEVVGAVWMVWQKVVRGEDLDSLGGGIICLMLGHQVVENSI